MKKLPSKLKNNFEINLDDTINSGQVFLWKKFDSKWYGVNGEKMLILEEKLDTNCRDIHKFFRFNDDFQKIKKQLSKDRVVKEAIKNFPGMRILRQDPFQCYISFVVSSNSNIPNIQNIIAIASGKGGVGKSTITANTAVSLAKMGFKVGVLDADIYGPSMHLMFDVEKERPISVNIEGRSKMKPVENYGVKLLSLGFFTNPDQAVIWRGPMASKALNQLIFDADWGELDFLLIDLPPGTGDVHLSIVQALPINGAVIVSTPQNIALADAKKGVAMFQQESIQVPVLGIVENMAYFTPEELPDNKYYIFGKEGAKGLAEQMDIELLAEIPIVQSIREAADAGRPAILQGATPIALELLKMSENIVSAIEKRNINFKPTESVKTTHSKGCST